MKTKLTIGIITCGRPQKVKECLSSIHKNIQLNYQVIVVDSMINVENLKLYEDSYNTRCIAFDLPISPSAARKIIAENVDTPYILFLDDDIIVTPSVSTMFRHIETHSDIDIIGGGWNEYGKFRELGQRFNFGTLDNRKIVYKSFITINDIIKLGLDSVQVDGVQATMLVKSNIFSKVQFDPRYDFFFELFDFFMQCHHEGIVIEALPSVIFEHQPSLYKSNQTMRQKSNKEDDRRKFIEKWGMFPIGPLSLLRRQSPRTLKEKVLSHILKAFK